MKREQLTVLISAVGGGGVGEQILKALRLAGGYRIVGADVRPRSAQFELVDQAVLLPAAANERYVEALLKAARKLAVDAVFPGSEPELRAMSDHREEIESAGLFLPINPAHVIDIGMDKLATVDFLERHGFAPPRSLRVEALADLAGIDWFPVVIKPVAASGGSRDCFIAQTPRQLELIGEYIGSGGAEMMIQEYVGTPDEEYTVGVLYDLDGHFINSIGLRRLLQGQLHQRLSVRNVTGRAELGNALVISSGVSHGQIDRYPAVTEPCERIAEVLGVRGAVNIQCRVVDGEVRVFEINPRLSGTTSIRALVGYNEPDVLLRHHLLGETIEPRFPYQSALVMRSVSEHVVSDRPIPSWDSL